MGPLLTPLLISNVGPILYVSFLLRSLCIVQLEFLSICVGPPGARALSENNLQDFCSSSFLFISASFGSRVTIFASFFLSVKKECKKFFPIT